MLQSYSRRGRREQPSPNGAFVGSGNYSEGPKSVSRSESAERRSNTPGSVSPSNSRSACAATLLELGHGPSEAMRASTFGTNTQRSHVAKAMVFMPNAPIFSKADSGGRGSSQKPARFNPSTTAARRWAISPVCGASRFTFLPTEWLGFALLFTSRWYHFALPTTYRQHTGPELLVPSVVRGTTPSERPYTRQMRHGATRRRLVPADSRRAGAGRLSPSCSGC